MRIRAVVALLIVVIAVPAVPHAQVQTVGLFLYDSTAYPGYNLFSPGAGTTTYIIDMWGRVINSWETTYLPGFSAYLLDNGDLLRTGRLTGGGGAGGLIQKYTWDGTLIWNYQYFTADVLQHHDIEPLPNGHVLILAWEDKTLAEAVAAGRDPAFLPPTELSPEHIVEVVPIGPTTGNIVWEWHLWDHLVQEFDSTKANYGVVADHPELVDINFPPETFAVDWIHANSINYNPDLDQIVISSHVFDEFWVIDHSTTSAEAAGHTGGQSGMGGDILYRWGNPLAYQAGDSSDQKLFGQHDARWVPAGLPGAGNIMVFNNGRGRPDGDYSSVDEITTPVDGNGHYPHPAPGTPYGPSELTWTYGETPPTSWFESNVSSSQRLPNGHTLICSGPDGTFFEVTPDSQVVWRYVQPVNINGIVIQGEPTLNNRVYRCTRLLEDYPGFVGHDLTPGAPVEINPITISGTAHSPLAPTQNQAVVITSKISSDNAITAVKLYADFGSGYVAMSMFDDGHHQDGLAGDSVYGVSIAPLGSTGLVPYYINAEDNMASSVNDPPNPPSTVYSYSVSYAAPRIVINEVLASNSACCADEQGDFDPWIELFNTETFDVDLSGMYLTNDLADSTRFMIGDTVLPARGFILFWADNELAEGPTHTNFVLGPVTGEIGLYDSDGNGRTLLDSVGYSGQSSDISYGREVDGAPVWDLFAEPTPDATNGGCSCPYQVDFDESGTLDALDLNSLIDALFFGGGNPQDTGCPTTRGDFDCSTAPDALDLNDLIDHLFFGGAGPCDPCAP